MHRTPPSLFRIPFVRVRSARLAAAAVAAATLVGCGSAPLSFLNDRQVYYRAVLHRSPVYVISVDGSSPGFRPVPITPGEHLLTLDAQSVGGLTQPVQKTYPITIEPCTRYYIAAQRDSALVQDWNLVVERTFPVGGCDPAREIERAKSTASASTQSIAPASTQSTAPASTQSTAPASTQSTAPASSTIEVAAAPR